MGMDQAEFDRLLAACKELADYFPHGIVFIGGIAVYLHAVNTPSVRELAELTHDADLYISLADMGDLRDLEEVTANRRLSKRLYRLTADTLLVWGAADRLIVPAYAAQWQALIPGARIEMIAGAGHMVPYEQPDAFAQAVHAFLA